MTERELWALMYLSDKMEANSYMVGEAIWQPCDGNIASIGAIVMGNLKKKGYVMRIPELKAWRITKSGRAAILTERVR